MNHSLTILQHGEWEPLKAGVHGATLGLAVVMGLYNAAAWIGRRERHLAVNAILYSLLIAWERAQVAHHLASLRECQEKAVAASVQRSPTIAPSSPSENRAA